MLPSSGARVIEVPASIAAGVTAVAHDIQMGCAPATAGGVQLVAQLLAHDPWLTLADATAAAHGHRGVNGPAHTRR